MENVRIEESLPRSFKNGAAGYGQGPDYRGSRSAMYSPELNKEKIKRVSSHEFGKQASRNLARAERTKNIPYAAKEYKDKAEMGIARGKDVKKWSTEYPYFPKDER